jgi:hypothetical protein
MPKAYSRVGAYYSQQGGEQANMLDRLEEAMKRETEYEDTQEVLRKIFPAVEAVNDGYTVNDYFEKNKEKYFTSSEEYLREKKIKLKYMDSFVTRYVYYSFTRWLYRIRQMLGFKPE